MQVRDRLAPARRRQRGAATLIVVLILFFVVSLAAAYAGRNLVFEQRTSSNQVRAMETTQATEAGIEWATAMLNSGRIDESCVPTADAAFDTFRARYLSTDPDTGALAPRLSASGARLHAACARVNGAWVCTCPRTADLTGTELPEGSPAFAVRFAPLPDKSGLTVVEANGCSRFSADPDDLRCLTARLVPAVSPACSGAACNALALYSSARSSPSAAVTARGDVTGSFSSANPDGASGGVAVLAGGVVGANVELNARGPAGSAGTNAVRANESALAAAIGNDAADCVDCLHAITFGLRPATYRRLGGVLEIDCSIACTAADVNGALAGARSSSVRLAGAGGLSLTSPADAIGSAANPVVLAIEGPLVMAATAGTGAAPRARVTGLVYADSAVLDGGEVAGALISHSTVSGSDGRVLYDAAVLRALRLFEGTFVRVSGGWRDFR